MANNRTSKSGSAAPKRARNDAPSARGATPRRAESTSKRNEPTPPESGGYLVPALLAVALVGAFAYYMHAKNRVAAEPASPEASADTTTPSTPTPTPAAVPVHAPEGNGAAPTRLPPPPMPNAPVQQDPQNVTVNAAHPTPTSPDPMGGHFTLAQATAGLPAGSNLVATIQTSMGNFDCTLMPEQAPITVANFVGLARGLRSFWDPVAGAWARRPFYDGSVFHRVIPDFMIQGGDILRSGHGSAGYEIPDENVTDHNSAGLLCMANHGPNTGGSQFFITESPRPHLNGSYSVFGRCTPTDLVGRIARTPRAPTDTPITPVYIQHVTVHR